MSKTRIKLAAAPRFELLYKQDHIIIPILKGQTSRLIEFLAVGEGLNLEKEYELELKISRSKRSKDANAYFWTLCEKLAKKLHRSDIEIYRDIIRDYGVRTIVPIAKDAVPRWIENWEQKGRGWICESLGHSKLAGYENIACYYGSSVYNTKEMSRIIDAIVEECKEQGIETMTPDELESLKQQWNVN